MKEGEFPMKFTKITAMVAAIATAAGLGGRRGVQRERAGRHGR
ncbi:hypothetical protein BBB_1707 [Bifidobacterium bifidum BGN4]|uniref:Uncharacterized protein n=1 Tax=Bifidobacterium bifidum BGN4 TaxID=484020 RepID=I3WK84_BIFBI|nr:hypothetical protein BBB_1707 [Bifidobacterium bifidum BGN4]